MQRHFTRQVAAVCILLVSASVGWAQFVWKVQGLPPVWRSVAYGAGQFCAVAGSGVVGRSPDGIAWHRDTLAVDYLGNVRFSQAAFMIAGADVFSSADADNWSVFSTQYFDLVVRGSDRWIGVMSSLGWILSSTDGAAWTDDTTLNRAVNDIRYENGVYVMAGYRAILSSTNGRSWTSRSTLTSGEFRSIAYGGGRFVVAGDGAVRYSTNGTAWSTASGAVANTFYSVAYGDSGFVAVGADGVIASSANGATWALRSSGVTARLYSVVFGGGVYVAVGDGGTVLTSVNGTTWIVRSHGCESEFDMLSIGHADSVTVIGGNQGRYVTVLRDTAWASSRTTSPYDYHAVCRYEAGTVFAGRATNECILMLSTIWSTGPPPIATREQPRTSTSYCMAAIRLSRSEPTEP